MELCIPVLPCTPKPGARCHTVMSDTWGSEVIVWPQDAFKLCCCFNMESDYPFLFCCKLFIHITECQVDGCMEIVFVCMPTVMCSCKACRDAAPASSQWIKITSHLSTSNSGKPNYFKMGSHCTVFFNPLKLLLVRLYDMTQVRSLVQANVHFHIFFWF